MLNELRNLLISVPCFANAASLNMMCELAARLKAAKAHAKQFKASVCHQQQTSHTPGANNPTHYRRSLYRYIFLNVKCNATHCDILWSENACQSQSVTTLPILLKQCAEAFTSKHSSLLCKPLLSIRPCCLWCASTVELV